ncbi:MAG: hypothetical protein V1920_06410 [Bacillota bacterium]
MKSIREAALNLEPTPPKAPIDPYDSYDDYGYSRPIKPHNSSLFDYDNYPSKSYKAPVKGVIEIKLSINNDELGPVGDENSSKYDWNRAQNKAEEIAYDRIQELLGIGFESKFSIEFNTYDDGCEYEVSCVLTPTT